MVGSKAIVKNKPGKAVGKNQSQQLASGIFLMMEQYGCWVTAADHRTTGGKMSPTDICPMASNCPTKKSKKCWHMGLFSWPVLIL